MMATRRQRTGRPRSGPASGDGYPRGDRLFQRPLIAKKSGTGFHPPSAARNRGVQEARGDLIALTDDDCMPRPEWLEALVAATGSAQNLWWVESP